MAYYFYDPITNTKKLIDEEDNHSEESVESLRLVLLENLMNVYKSSIINGFNSLATGEDVRYGYKEQDQLNYSKLANLFALNPNKSSTIIGSDSHGVITLTREQFLKFMEDAENYEMNMYVKRKLFEEKILNAKTIDELNLIQVIF